MGGVPQSLTAITLAAAISALVLFGGTAMAAIKGSKHDLGAGGGGFGADTPGNTNEICIFCHTPHTALVSDPLVGRLPLWNRAVTDNSAVPRYTMYNSGTVPEDSTAALGGVTLLCLGCHDGVTAFDSVLNAPNSGTITNKKTHNGRITDLLDNGNGLSNDHPVGMTYAGSSNKTGGAQAGYLSQASAEVAGAKFYNMGGEEDEVTCASCHEPHNSTGFATFLRADQSTDSGMCRICHVK